MIETFTATTVMVGTMKSEQEKKSLLRVGILALVCMGTYLLRSVFVFSFAIRTLSFVNTWEFTLFYWFCLEVFPLGLTVLIFIPILNNRDEYLQKQKRLQQQPDSENTTPDSTRTNINARRASMRTSSNTDSNYSNSGNNSAASTVTNVDSDYSTTSTTTTTTANNKSKNNNNFVVTEKRKSNMYS